MDQRRKFSSQSFSKSSYRSNVITSRLIRNSFNRRHFVGSEYIFHSGRKIIGKRLEKLLLFLQNSFPQGSQIGMKNRIWHGNRHRIPFIDSYVVCKVQLGNQHSITNYFCHIIDWIDWLDRRRRIFWPSRATSGFWPKRWTGHFFALQRPAKQAVNN